MGITSACAEQTRRNTALPSRAWDYLRVCGADLDMRVAIWRSMGLPPRVRSRLGEYMLRYGYFGITSACAEQTHPNFRHRRILGDYLRVCGADAALSVVSAPSAGLPPRVRSRRWVRRSIARPHRITSACAEQTGSRHLNDDGHRDYLRVCGADMKSTLRYKDMTGLPPRVRSRRPQSRLVAHELGITSACAEQTSSHFSLWQG